MDPYVIRHRPLGFNGPALRNNNCYTGSNVAPENYPINNNYNYNNENINNKNINSYTSENINNYNNKMINLSQWPLANTNSLHNWIASTNDTTKKYNTNHPISNISNIINISNNNFQYNSFNQQYPLTNTHNEKQRSNVAIHPSKDITDLTSLYPNNWTVPSNPNEDTNDENNLYHPPISHSNSGNSPKYFSSPAGKNIGYFSSPAEKNVGYFSSPTEKNMGFVNPNASLMKMDQVIPRCYFSNNPPKYDENHELLNQFINQNVYTTTTQHDEFLNLQVLISNGACPMGNVIMKEIPLQCVPQFANQYNGNVGDNALQMNQSSSFINNTFGAGTNENAFYNNQLINKTNSFSNAKHCSRRCRKSYSIHQNMSSNDKNTSPFVCDYKDCGKMFKRRDDLKRHIKMHYGGKPFACEFCCSSFGRTDHLRTHIRVHSGEKPYKCVICEKAFKRSDERSRHFLSHDKKDGLTPGTTKQSLKVKGLLEKVYVSRMSASN